MFTSSPYAVAPGRCPNSQPRRLRYNGNLEIIQMLLDAGADPNRISAYGNSSPLTDAIKAKRHEAARLLIKAGANVNTHVDYGRCALHDATELLDFDLIDLCLQSGADVNARDEWGFTPLHIACSKGSLEAAKKFLAAGANINAQLNDGLTPLMQGVEHASIVQMLLEAGANVSLKTKKKETVFTLAEKFPKTLHLLEKYN